MDYRTKVKLNLMKGLSHISKGQGIITPGAIRLMRLDNQPRLTGTISHRVAVGQLEPEMQKLTISKRKAPKKKTKGAGTNKSQTYKSLKFNF